MDDETIVSLFSLTKAMTASAMAVLVDNEQLAWDSTVVSVLPDFQHQSSIVQSHTTVRDFLTHQAGLGQYNAL
jgi:CubicO group peptidase (beta-lactamase class C family)